MKRNTVDFQRILAYEEGGLDEYETVDLFQDLVDTGLAWELQGSYGREAQRMIRAGVIEERKTAK